jgi:hypothetical protein
MATASITIIQPDWSHLTNDQVLRHVNQHLKYIGALGNLDQTELSFSLAVLVASEKVGFQFEERADWEFILTHPSLVNIPRSSLDMLLS